jgi:hypothetical protein
MILYEVMQQQRVTLFLADEQLDDSHQMRQLVRTGEASRGLQQIDPLRLFAPLKGRNGPGDESPLLLAQMVADVRGNLPRMPGVMLEVIQPDL